MWQTKYALVVPKNLGVGVDFWPCSEGEFFTGLSQSMLFSMVYSGGTHIRKFRVVGNDLVLFAIMLDL